MNKIEEITNKQLNPNVPEFRVGDTVRVGVRIIEGKKERVQAFEGVVISRKGYGVSETFTVRKMSSGIGVERIFPIHSPKLDSIEVVRKGKARRAKLYYLRERTGKASKTKEMVGARIENKMITIKEEVKEEPAKEVEAVAEEAKTEATAE